jgi:hypothetical protein
VPCISSLENKENNVESFLQFPAVLQPLHITNTPLASFTPWRVHLLDLALPGSLAQVFLDIEVAKQSKESDHVEEEESCKEGIVNAYDNAI